MKTEDRLRDALHSLSEGAEPPRKAWTAIQSRLRSDHRRNAFVAAGVALLVVSIIITAVALVTTRGSSPRRVTTRPDDRSLSMPSEIVAVTTAGKLVILSSGDGHVIRHLADHAVNDTEPATASELGALAVAPDAKTVYFLSRDLSGNGPRGESTIASVPVAGGKVTRPFGNNCCVHNPTVSPDGRWLAVSGAVHSSDAGSSILLYDLGRALPRDASSYARRWDSSAPSHQGVGPLAWAPDSQHLAFIHNDAPNASEPRVLDINAPQSTVLDQLPPVRFHEDAGSWAGYLGDTGKMLAVVGWRVVAVDSATGMVTNTLFELAPATQPVADLSGQHIILRSDNSLYVWSAGQAAPRKLARNVLAAAWVPRAASPGTVHGRLVAKHAKGLVTSGTGPVAGTISVQTAGRTVIRQVTVAVNGYSISLPPGRYVLAGAIKDGQCDPAPLDLMSGTTVAVNLSCVDGNSTD